MGLWCIVSAVALSGLTVKPIFATMVFIFNIPVLPAFAAVYGFGVAFIFKRSDEELTTRKAVWPCIGFAIGWNLWVWHFCMSPGINCFI